MPQWAFVVAMDLAAVIPREPDRERYGGSSLRRLTLVHGCCNTKNLSKRTNYYYRVKATNDAGSSAYSNVASATTK